MLSMTWFWRLVCSPECDDACQTNCPGCKVMQPEWERQGRYSPAAAQSAHGCGCGPGGSCEPAPAVSCGIGPDAACTPGCGCDPGTVERASGLRRLYLLWRCWSGSASARLFAFLLSPFRALFGLCASSKDVGTAAIRQAVRGHYSAQAANVCDPADGCCSPALPVEVSAIPMYASEDLRGVPAQALLASLGCGNPLARAGLQPGEIVLDLGSGGGMDVLVAAGRVAPHGRVYGLDTNDDMLDLARANARNFGAGNVEFLRGDMESIPLPDESVDVIISNCVVNLSPDKDRALREAFRVLRPGGRLSISDIVTRRPVPASLKRSLTAWAACIGGALSQDEYRIHLHFAGFSGIMVETDREYTAQDAQRAGLAPLLAEVGLEAVGTLGFASASVVARKPVLVPPPARPSVVTTNGKGHRTEVRTLL
jgi:arsenite methyltransferase